MKKREKQCGKAGEGVAGKSGEGYNKVMQWLKKKLPTILLVLVFLTGVALLLYPTFADWWNSFHQSRAVASYMDSVSALDTEQYEEILAEADAYNQKLAETGVIWTLDEEQEKEYNDQLNINSLPNTNKHKSSNKYIFYRKNHTENNINTDFSIKAKISRNNTIKIESNRQNSFDSSFRLMNKSTDKIDKTHHKGSKINDKNYKTKLNNIQRRMTTLIGNLINYIKILKKDK